MKPTVPLPVVLAPDVTVIQGLLLTAVQTKSVALEVTETLPLCPAATGFHELELSVTLPERPDCVMENVLSPMVMEPLREATVVEAATV